MTGDAERLGLRYGSGDIDPDRLAALAAQHGCAVDMDATFPVVQRHGLTF